VSVLLDFSPFWESHATGTVWIWLHKLRTERVNPRRDRLSGTVEVDETYIDGKKPGKPRRGLAWKTLLLIVVEDNDNYVGRIRLQRVRDAGAESLILAIQAIIEPSSTDRTDGWIS
jgi:hypothetical protein